MKQPKLNKHSKILKEFNSIFAHGQYKVSFLHIKNRLPSKYERFVTETVKQVRIPLIKAKLVESADDLPVKNIIDFDQYHQSFVSRSRSISNANLRIQRSIREGLRTGPSILE